MQSYVYNCPMRKHGVDMHVKTHLPHKMFLLNTFQFLKASNTNSTGFFTAINLMITTYVYVKFILSVIAKFMKKLSCL